MSRSGRTSSGSSSSSSSSSSSTINEVEPSPSSKTSVTQNLFKNDGSFLEMFKKMQQQSQAKDSGSVKKTDIVISSSSTAVASAAAATARTAAPPEEEAKPKATAAAPLPMVGKRRGGRALPTGLVKKSKKEGEEEQTQPPKDAWSQYMAEVRRYKETSCEEEDMPQAVKMSSEYKMETAPFDPRFPNQNQTRYCYQSYVDFHRCRRVKGEDYAPCEYFRKVYQSLCPNAWVEKWDTQIEENRFPGRL